MVETRAEHIVSLNDRLRTLCRGDPAVDEGLYEKFEMEFDAVYFDGGNLSIDEKMYRSREEKRNPYPFFQIMRLHLNSRRITGT